VKKNGDDLLLGNMSEKLFIIEVGFVVAEEGLRSELIEKI